MTLGGAVMKLNIRSRMLVVFGNLVKSMVPYMVLYRLYALILLPRRNHRESRLLFIREAKRLARKEFMKWFGMTAELGPLLRLFREKETGIPTLYVMGEEDHMFLPSVRKLVNKHNTSSLLVIPSCGHVVNVEQPRQFNDLSLEFIRSVRN
jgi:pimeloyl-ACP methyl ester carboxylesterase